MTTSESIITWLKGFNPTEYWTMDRIDTDVQSSSPLTFALIKEPTINIKRYLSGMEEHTEYYQISARLDSQTNADRMVNGEFFVALEKWVASKRKSDDLPTITDAEVDDVKVTSGYYLGMMEDNSSIYSITISITFTRR